MDITRHNFKETYEIVEKAVSEANFVAVDGEFSGVTNSTFNLTNYDSPEERYHKLKHNVADFLLMQFGLVTFKWNPEKEEYIAEAFNFYIFPFRSSGSGIPDRIFSCQGSSIDFLTAQNFDFNKVFHSGISYLRSAEEASMRAALNEKHIMRLQNYKSPRKSLENNGNSTSTDTSPAGSPTVISDPKTQAFVDGIKAKIETFLKTSNEGGSLELEPCNSYLRKILYETIPTMFPEPLALEAHVNEKTKQRYLVVLRVGSPEAMQQRKDQARAKDEALLQDSIGFSRIIQLLTRSQKLLIGHNMLLDLMFTTQQFVRPLPQTLEEFKSLLSCTFPKIVDTKLMGSMLPFRELIFSTALGEMHNRLASHPFCIPDIIPPDKYDPSKSDHNMDINLHEAAYDAYITGVSFLSMLNFLSSFRKQGKSQALANPSSDVISPYMNKVFLMRSPDIPYLNLAGNDLTPSRAHVFHVQFPPTWRANDVRMLFGPIGSAVYISWINDVQCFVGLHDKSQAKQVKKLLIKPGGVDSNLYTVRTYEEYQRDIAGQIFLTPTTFKHSYNPATYSRNKVWRPNNGTTAVSTTSGTSIVQPTPSSGTDTPKSLIANRKRSGEESTAVKPLSVRRISSTSNCFNSLDIDEPDVKRKRSQDSATPIDVDASTSIARTDLPSLLISDTDPKDEEMDKDSVKEPSVSFEVPSNWG
uniref:poly(A)-specific ribonuclease PARN-like n=1 Tax=Styela clava TaxID=7725 RepID=UPI001939DA99|nr:poly(A)-specific ribonuclease PARN-like [Styela clava]